MTESPLLAAPLCYNPRSSGCLHFPAVSTLVVAVFEPD